MDPIQQLRSELRAEFSSTIDNLRDEIQSLQHALQQASLPKTQPLSSKRPKSSLPDPEKFTGLVVKYDTWDAAIRAKLAIDGPAIGDSSSVLLRLSQSR